MRLRGYILIALGILTSFVLFRAYSDRLQTEWQAAYKNERHFKKRFSASIGALGLPQPRKVEFSEIDTSLLGSTAKEIADNYLLVYKESLGIQDYHTAQGVEHKTPLGSIIKYTFSQDSVPIVGMEINIRIGSNLMVEDIENNYRALERAEINNLLEDAQREDLAQLLPSRYGVDPSSGPPDTILYVTAQDPSPVPSYVVRTTDRGKQNRKVDLVIRAADGQILGISVPRQEFSHNHGR